MGNEQQNNLSGTTFIPQPVSITKVEQADITCALCDMTLIKATIRNKYEK